MTLTETLLLFTFSFLTTKQIEEKKVFQPEVLLVQLSSEHNRMEALKAQGDEEGMKQLDKDLHGVFRAIRNDFRDNFTACPVYYFIDTNLSKITAGHLTHVLADADGYIQKGNPIKGKRFQIAYYGYPKMRMRRTGYLPKEDENDFDTQAGKAWVVCDEEMNQVSYSKPRRDPGRMSDRPEDKDYRYRSPEFDIYYRPSAKLLQSAMLNMGPR